MSDLGRDLHLPDRWAVLQRALEELHLEDAGCAPSLDKSVDVESDGQSHGEIHPGE